MDSQGLRTAAVVCNLQFYKYLSILMHCYSAHIKVTVKKFEYLFFTFLLHSEHVSALTGHPSSCVFTLLKLLHCSHIGYSPPMHFLFHFTKLHCVYILLTFIKILFKSFFLLFFFLNLNLLNSGHTHGTVTDTNKIITTGRWGKIFEHIRNILYLRTL
jgi:hypothetical protein